MMISKSNELVLPPTEVITTDMPEHDPIIDAGIDFYRWILVNGGLLRDEEKWRQKIGTTEYHERYMPSRMEDDSGRGLAEIVETEIEDQDGKLGRMYGVPDAKRTVLHIAGNDQGVKPAQGNAALQRYIDSVALLKNMGITDTNVAYMRPGRAYVGELPHKRKKNSRVRMAQMQNVLPELLKGTEKLFVTGDSRGAGAIWELCHRLWRNKVEPLLRRNKLPNMKDIHQVLIDGFNYYLPLWIFPSSLKKFPKSDIPMRGHAFTQMRHAPWELDISASDIEPEDARTQRGWIVDANGDPNVRHSDMDEFMRRHINAALEEWLRGVFNYRDPLQSYALDTHSGMRELEKRA